MSRLSVPSFESATGATAEIYVDAVASEEGVCSMLRKTMIVLVIAAALTGGLTAVTMLTD